MSMNDLTGQMLGNFELRALLGIGGMGTVYRGFQPSLKREVAVKVLSGNLAQQGNYVERFTREAEISATLEHAHIVPIFDYGVQDNMSYVVMRLLTGGSLSQRIQQRQENNMPLPSLSEISKLLNQVASALDYAHSQGVIHRDIKPSNIMFDNHGNAFIVDFGIAKITEETNAITGTGTTLGTPFYMPPEQWRAEPLTPAADQYALGIMIYELVTGRVPFEAGTPFALMHKHLHEIPTPPQEWRADLPEAVTLVIERAIAKEPGDRFPTATAFAQAFEHAIQGYNHAASGFFTFKLDASMPQPVLSKTAPTSGETYIPTEEALKASGADAGRGMLIKVLGFVLALIVIIIAGLTLLGNDDEADKAVARATSTPRATATDEPLPTLAIIPTLDEGAMRRLTIDALSLQATATRSIEATMTEIAALDATIIALQASSTPTITPTASATDMPTITPTASATDTPTTSPSPTNDPLIEAVADVQINFVDEFKGELVSPITWFINDAAGENPYPIVDGAGYLHGIDWYTSIVRLEFHDEASKNNAFVALFKYAPGEIRLAIIGDRIANNGGDEYSLDLRNLGNTTWEISYVNHTAETSRTYFQNITLVPDEWYYYYVRLLDDSHFELAIWAQENPQDYLFNEVLSIPEAGEETIIQMDIGMYVQSGDYWIKMFKELAVDADFALPEQPPSSPQMVIGSTGIDLREEPNRTSAVSVQVADTTLPIIGVLSNGNWYLVGNDQQQGWMRLLDNVAVIEHHFLYIPRLETP